MTTYICNAIESQVEQELLILGLEIFRKNKLLFDCIHGSKVKLKTKKHNTRREEMMMDVCKIVNTTRLHCLGSIVIVDELLDGLQRLDGGLDVEGDGPGQQRERVGGDLLFLVRIRRRQRRRRVLVELLGLLQVLVHARHREQPVLLHVTPSPTTWCTAGPAARTPPATSSASAAAAAPSSARRAAGRRTDPPPARPPACFAPPPVCPACRQASCRPPSSSPA